jgi:predicted PurR-regulated permease PerM
MKYEKIPYFKFIPIILISAILFRVVNSIGNIAGLLGSFLSLFSYFFWGFAIAYLLNPLMVYIERKTKVKRALALLIVYALFIGVISLVCVLVVPIVVKNVVDLIGNMPDYIINLQRWITELTTTNKYLVKYDISSYMEDTLNNSIKNANTYLGMGLKILVGNLINLSNVLIKFITGIVISLYLLKDKENFLLNIKKLLTIMLDEKKTSIIISFGDKVNNIFKRFVIGKFVDSIIVGLICFAALIVLKIPYAIIISIIVGGTNMIPYFGNIIGLVPACLITLLASPLKSLEVGIVILVLMQFDGLFLGPKIIGEKIGLNPIWIILGITLGGGIYGILGMFLGVPIVAVLKLLLQEFVERNLKENNLEV